MPHVNDLNFPKYMFAFKFLQTLKDNFFENKIALKERAEHIPWINEFGFEKECVSSE